MAFSAFSIIIIHSIQKTMSYSSRNPQDKRTHQLPEVADREPGVPARECLDLSIDPQTEDLVDLKSYKVFMKRNLKWQAPPADLLASINARLDKVKAGEE
ncbi:MAG: hypothetical protein ACI81P_000723 [Neolewinella sp.]